MRWFTHDHAAFAEYERHLAEIQVDLPEGLRVLNEGGGRVSLHDGWFIRVGGSLVSPDVLAFDVACWDMENGVLFDNAWNYPLFHVRIAYRPATLLMPTWERLAQIWDRAEILYGEIDRSDAGGFEHRLLLWPPDAGHVAVRCETVDVAVVRFVEGRAEIVHQSGVE